MELRLGIPTGKPAPAPATQSSPPGAATRRCPVGAVPAVAGGFASAGRGRGELVRSEFVGAAGFQRTNCLPGEVYRVDWWHTDVAVGVGKSVARETSAGRDAAGVGGERCGVHKVEDRRGLIRGAGERASTPGWGGGDGRGRQRHLDRGVTRRRCGAAARGARCVGACGRPRGSCGGPCRRPRGRSNARSNACSSSCLPPRAFASVEDLQPQADGLGPRGHLAPPSPSRRRGRRRHGTGSSAWPTSTTRCCPAVTGRCRPPAQMDARRRDARTRPCPCPGLVREAHGWLAAGDVRSPRWTWAPTTRWWSTRPVTAGQHQVVERQLGRGAWRPVCAPPSGPVNPASAGALGW